MTKKQAASKTLLAGTWHYIPEDKNSCETSDSISRPCWKMIHFLSGTYYTHLKRDISASPSMMQRSHSYHNLAQVKLHSSSCLSAYHNSSKQSV
jgi:hypothetical protein